MARDRHDEIAEVLRRRLEELRERDGVVSRPAPDTRRSETAAPVDWAGARQLAGRWEAAYRGRSPAEALGGKPVGGRDDLLEVRFEQPLAWTPPSRERAREAILGSLWLVPGVRDATAGRLATGGRSTLSHLVDHPRFGRDARRLCRLVDRGDAAGVMAEVAARAGRGHLHALRVVSFFDPDQVLFLDIETMGLFGGSPVIVCGFARVRPDRIEVRQLVAARPEAEEALIRETGRTLAAHAALVTFNGRAFDYPYLCQRAAYYGLDPAEDPAHFDLLPHARRVWRGRVSDCRLGTLAREVLGLERHDDLPGDLVPAFYQDYLADPEGRVGLLAAIAAHNRDDMVEMVRLFARMVADLEVT